MPGPMSLLGEGWVCLVLGPLGGMPSPRSPLGCGVCIQEGVGIPRDGCTGGKASIPEGVCMHTPRHGT